jgi:hypothetical protein
MIEQPSSTRVIMYEIRISGDSSTNVCQFEQVSDDDDDSQP